MTNPFLSKMYSQQPRQELDSNIYSYDPSIPFQNNHQNYRSELSSPEERDDSSAFINKKQS